MFQGSLLVIVIMIDGSKNAIVKAAFDLQSSHVCEKRSKEREKEQQSMLAYNVSKWQQHVTSNNVVPIARDFRNST